MRKSINWVGFREAQSGFIEGSRREGVRDITVVAVLLWGTKLDREKICTLILGTRCEYFCDKE